MWGRIKRFFRDSETIFWSRLQTVAGAAALVLTYVDPALLAPILPDKSLPWFMLLNGLATEYLRRRRSDL